MFQGSPGIDSAWTMPCSIRKIATEKSCSEGYLESNEAAPGARRASDVAGDRAVIWTRKNA